MVIVNAVLKLSSAWYNILSFNQCFIIEILPYCFVAKNIGNPRKYDIFFNFCFTETMIFLSIAESQENMIFTLNIFTKRLFFMRCVLFCFLVQLSNIFWKAIAIVIFFFCLLRNNPCISTKKINITQKKRSFFIKRAL